MCVRIPARGKGGFPDERRPHGGRQGLAPRTAFASRSRLNGFNFRPASVLVASARRGFTFAGGLAGLRGRAVNGACWRAQWTSKECREVGRKRPCGWCKGGGRVADGGCSCMQNQRQGCMSSWWKVGGREEKEKGKGSECCLRHASMHMNGWVPLLIVTGFRVEDDCKEGWDKARACWLMVPRMIAFSGGGPLLSGGGNEYVSLAMAPSSCKEAALFCCLVV